MYLFETHYGASALTDDQTGITLEWVNGRFNETQKTRQDGGTLLTLVPKDENPASFLARKLREMGEYIVKEYPDLI